jgi:lipoprotein signal peptidase
MRSPYTWAISIEQELTMVLTKKKMILYYLLLAGVALLVVGLDQWTKHMVRTRLAYGAMWSPWEWLEPYARIIHWDNSGAAFGMLQGPGHPGFAWHYLLLPAPGG